MINRETLFNDLLKAYVDRCYYLSECMDNYLNPFLGLQEEGMFTAGALELIKSGQYVEAKVIFRLLLADISLNELFKQLRNTLNDLPSEEELEAFLNKAQSRTPPKVEIPF